MRNFTKALCGVLLVTGSLFAAEGEEIERKHISVGEREVSYAERIAQKEIRSLEMEENQEEDDTEELSENAKIDKAVKGKTYVTTHNGAYQYPYSIAFDGSSVELLDGSIWTVKPADRSLTFNWLTNDSIIIVPYHNIFSVYNYKLINLNTGAHVRVNLALGPFYNGISTHWVILIDIINLEVMLEDGTLWKMSSWDKSTVKKWYLNDTVIIGINDGWLSKSNPNMLINVNTNDYAIGSCLY